MIRILHSVSNMDRGGLETMIMNYYRHIDRDRFQFEFLSNKPQPGSYEPEIEALGGHVFRAPGFDPLKYGAYVDYFRGILEQYPDIEAVHVHNGELSVYALEAAKRCGVKVRFYHAHNTRISGSGILLKTALKPFIKYLATDYLACGDEAARFYFGGLAKKRGCTVIHNAIESERFVYAPRIREKIRREYGLGDAPVIGHVGSFSRAKNQLFLVGIFCELVKKAPDCRLVLIGGGEMQEQVREKAAALGVDGRIIYTGVIPNVNEWYQAFDVFVMPSLFEGLPVVGVEAEASGLPCLFSSAVPAEADILGTARFLALDEDAGVWADEIAGMLGRRDERRDMTDEIREAGYDVAVETGKLERLYIDAINRR